MTKPTQAQREAAQDAIMKTEYRPDRIVALAYAEAALTAAAEVEKKELGEKYGRRI